jgi:hypothetical protein
VLSRKDPVEQRDGKLVRPPLCDGFVSYPGSTPCSTDCR